jgi:AcrR family transcriptional regulator
VRDAKAGLILDASRRVFAAKGYHQTRLEDIAAAAGFSKASLYNYYSDKEEIFFCLAAREFDLLLAALETAVAPGDSVWAALERNLRNLFAFYGTNFALLLGIPTIRLGHEHGMAGRFAARHAALFSQCRKKHDAILKTFVALFASARRRSQISTSLDNATVGGYAMCLARGTMFQWGVARKMGDVEKEIRQIVGFVAHGVGAERPAKRRNQGKKAV